MGTPCWGIWAHKRGKPNVLIFLMWVYQSGYSKSRATLLGRKLLKKARLSTWIVELHSFNRE